MKSVMITILSQFCGMASMGMNGCTEFASDTDSGKLSGMQTGVPTSTQSSITPVPPFPKLQGVHWQDEPP